MWPGPYGDHGSRKYLLASLDASLRRMGLDYVDIFYSHRPDPDTPLEETMGALVQAQGSGKALYIGVSNYPADRTREAAKILRGMGIPPADPPAALSHVRSRSRRRPTGSLCRRGHGRHRVHAASAGALELALLRRIARGFARGLGSPFLKPEGLGPERLSKVRALNEIAAARGQSLAQMALRWTLRDDRMTSALIGASRTEQVEENAAAFSAPPLSAGELGAIDRILARLKPQSSPFRDRRRP